MFDFSVSISTIYGSPVILMQAFQFMWHNISQKNNFGRAPDDLSVRRKLAPVDTVVLLLSVFFCLKVESKIYASLFYGQKVCFKKVLKYI